MKVLVIGSGGREHAIVWKVLQNPVVDKLFCAPGNAGIAQNAECVDIPVQDKVQLLKFAIKHKIDLTLVGPEAPLVDGIVDLFEENGLTIFGPSRRAAELEGSKAFCKFFLEKYDIPTADYRTFTDYEKAKTFLTQHRGSIVVKADGLAAGKGVMVCKQPEDALMALDRIMKRKDFGAAGDKVVIEECLTGREVSVMALSDGERLITLVPSQDHKRIFDNDEGPNTGGMGAYAPTPQVSEELMKEIVTTILEPTIKGMALEDRPYKGVLYAGLMLTSSGPKVLEYNVRFGDPETQAVLPMSESDLVEAIWAIHQGTLDDIKWKNKKGAAVCVVLASGGYPGEYSKGKTIIGLDNQWDKGTIIFHAGTKRQGLNIVTNGGRVLGVTALDSSLPKAVDSVYKAVKRITFDGAYYRRDIAHRALR